MSYSNSFPQQRPTLNLDFANSGKLDSRISYSRSSGGTYLSNEKALNSENLLLDSKTGTGNWTGNKSGAALVPVITANHAASPDGTANQSTRVQLDLNGSTTGSDYARYYQAHNVANGTSATFCIWAKSTDGASSYAAQLLAPDGSGTAITITGSWQKFSVTATSVGNVTYGIRLRGGQTPTNADTADILIWGANLSTTGQTVLSETTTQIHREFAPLLKTAAANAPRFEYAADGQSVGSGTALGLLVESQATNLTKYSDDFASWGDTSTVAVTSDAGVAPNGQLEADLLVSPSSASAHYILDSTIAFTSGTTYTASVYVKSAGHRYVQLCGNSAAFSSPYKWVNYDLEAGTLNANNCSGTITAVGNGYYRITATMTASSTMTRSFILMFADSLSTGFFPTTTGDAYSGFLAYGFQTEVGSASSSLISTNGSQVSRAADSCSLVSAPLLDNGSGGLTVEYDMQLANETSYVLHTARSSGATNSDGVNQQRVPQSRG